MTDKANTADEGLVPYVAHTKLEKVLVVISPDLVQSSAPEKSSLLMRAIALSKATGCELELFHVCYDSSLKPAFFTDRSELRREQEQCLDRDATLLAEMVVRLKVQRVTFSWDTRWDDPRTDAILRKIHDSRPDLVMKQSREHGYTMGFLENTDWDLIRLSPAHLWFVTEDGVDNINRLVTAVGTHDENDEMFAAADYDVFRMANLIAKAFGATNFPVHAYQVPQVRSDPFTDYMPLFGGISAQSDNLSATEKVRRKIAIKHGDAITAFAKYFNFEPRHVQIAEGPPADVIPNIAGVLNADLIVMAASNMSGWQRLVQAVAAEPVLALALAPCDVVFIKDSQDTQTPAADNRPTQGIPAYDLEKAVLDPEHIFGSPEAVAEAQEISLALRKRILQIWEQDIRSQMVEEDEGGPIKDINVDLLDKISLAKAKVMQDFEDADAAPAELTFSKKC